MSQLRPQLPESPAVGPDVWNRRDKKRLRVLHLIMRYEPTFSLRPFSSHSKSSRNQMDGLPKLMNSSPSSPASSAASSTPQETPQLSGLVHNQTPVPCVCTARMLEFIHIHSTRYVCCIYLNRCMYVCMYVVIVVFFTYMHVVHICVSE